MHFYIQIHKGLKTVLNYSIIKMYSEVYLPLNADVLKLAKQSTYIKVLKTLFSQGHNSGPPHYNTLSAGLHHYLVTRLTVMKPPHARQAGRLSYVSSLPLCSTVPPFHFPSFSSLGAPFTVLHGCHYTLLYRALSVVP